MSLFCYQYARMSMFSLLCSVFSSDNTLLLSHLQALWISDEKAEGCNFHYYLPFVKELFPLLDHPKQIESEIGLKRPIHRLKDIQTLF